MSQSTTKINLPSEDTSFAIIEKDGEVSVFEGNLHALKHVYDIQHLAEEESKDIVFVLPYHVIRERGYEAHGDEPVLALSVDSVESYDKKHFLKNLPHQEIITKDGIVPSVTDNDHADNIRHLMEEDIEGGNASQVNFSRYFSGQIKGYNLETAYSIFASLLKTKGQYMTVLFYNANDNSVIVGAPPEGHLEVTETSTKMMPIAGTLRKEDHGTFEKRLAQFLTDPKEVNELYQVVDEELKMMGRICPGGGRVEGPFLKEIGNVIHTYYLLEGLRAEDPIKSLISTFHALTVVGSPMESAARIIKKRENTSRRYYSGEIGYYKYKERKKGSSYGNLDTAILIRCAEIRSDGSFRIQAGGGIVRDSLPDSEVKETRAKASVVLDVLSGLAEEKPTYLTSAIHDKFRPVLMQRNKGLSPFWITPQSRTSNDTQQNITLINNEDDFCFMVGHILAHEGYSINVVDTFAFDPEKDNSDLVIAGPGPGDINDTSNPRMVRLLDIIRSLKKAGKPILGVCLGHQALSRSEGIEVARQNESTQGLQRLIEIKGSPKKLAFYNSFSPIYTQEAVETSGIEFDVDNEGRILALYGEDFTGFQFHPESVMSPDGYDLIIGAVKDLLGCKS